MAASEEKNTRANGTRPATPTRDNAANHSENPRRRRELLQTCRELIEKGRELPKTCRELREKTGELLKKGRELLKKRRRTTE